MIIMKYIIALFRYLGKPEVIVGLIFLGMGALVLSKMNTISTLKVEVALHKEEASRLSAERDSLRKALDKQNDEVSRMQFEQLSRNRDSLARMHSVFSTADFIRTPPGAEGMNEWFSKSFR